MWSIYFQVYDEPANLAYELLSQSSLINLLIFYEPLKIAVFHGHHDVAPGAKPLRAALALAGHDRYKQLELLISSQPISLIWVHVDQTLNKFTALSIDEPCDMLHEQQESWKQIIRK